MVGDSMTFPFSAIHTMVSADVIQKLRGVSSISYFGHFIGDDVISLEETNRYEDGIRKVLSRNRFKLLLTMFYLSKNEEPVNPKDRLHKIFNFLNIFKQKFKLSFYPEEEVCIDESNVPFR